MTWVKVWRKIAIILGASLLLVGVMIFVYGYLTHYVPYESFGENGGYTYLDRVAMYGSLFVFAGLAVLVLTLMLSLRAKRYTGRYMYR